MGNILDNHQRKATDILLEIESKLDKMMNVYKTLSFDIKILSNKLNSITNTNNNLHNDTKHLVEIKQEDTLPIEISPEVSRRTSRPENYSVSSADTNVVVPSSPVTKNVIANSTNDAENEDAYSFKEFKKSEPNLSSNVTIVQRIVDKNGKSLFLADVEVINPQDNSVKFKTRTNASGKWEAQVPPGNYNVMIKKREALTKGKIEVTQTINVDGNESLLNLDMLIIK